MSGTISQPSEPDWLKHKNWIRYEYLVKETSLKDLMVLLRAQGFHTTKGQLEYKLKSWDIFRNLDKEAWKYVERTIGKRKQEGKESDVIYCGRRLQRTKVTKETNRHRETNIIARFKTPPPPSASSQVSICTPPTFQTDFEWPSSLPWLRLRNIWDIIIKDTGSKDVTVHHNDPSKADIALSLMVRRLTLHDTKKPSVSLSKLIALVIDIIPEQYPGEHIKIAQNLFAGPTAEFLSECVKVLICMMSNSSVTEDDRQLDFFPCLLGPGLNDLLSSFSKLRSKSPNIRAFLERLFKYEIHEATSPFINSGDRPRSLSLIRRLLELGQDPNCPCAVYYRRNIFLFTPIQQATEAGYLELIQLLLRFHARPIDPPTRNQKDALINIALNSGCSSAQKLRVLELLFDHLFLNKDEMLRAAIELGDVVLMVKMLECGADPTSYETSWLHPARRREQLHSFSQTYFAKPSPLMMAVKTGGIMATSMLDYLLLKGQPAPSILAEACIAAAYGGDDAIVRRLDEMHPFETTCSREGITPLQAAVVGGNVTVCQYLLERYGGASGLLVLAAAELAKSDVLQLLIDSGGNPNDLVCTRSTRLNWYIESHPYSIREFTVKLLMHAGAKATGGEVVRAIYLREQDTVLYLLQHGGTLTDVDDTGRGCLEAEIEAQNDRTLQDALEMQEFAIDAGPFCAAIQVQDWDLVTRLFGRAHKPTDCHLLEGTAVGLAAGAGKTDILNMLLNRFTHPSVLRSAILPLEFKNENLEVFDGYRERAGYWRAPTAEEGGPSRSEGSPLTLAALGENTSGFRELLRCGCSMDRIAWTTIADSERCSNYLQLLREFGCRLGTSTKQDSQLRTALCKAIDVGNHDMARYLVEVGADVNEFDISIAARSSPLQCAVKKGDIDMAVYLLQQGSNINAPPGFSQSATALQFAAIGGHIGFAGHLIQLGARVNARGSGRFGRSALEGAAEHGRLDMLALLVHFGAVTTGQGRQQLINAIAYAQANALHTVVEWLKEICDWADADEALLELTEICYVAVYHMVALGLFLGLLVLSAECVAQSICETSLGSSSVDVLRTSTSTRVETLTLTDKIISRRTSTVGRNTTTTTIRATFTKLATVKASPEAKIATITVTIPTLVNRTETTTETKTNKNTITTTSFFDVTISKKPGFTAIGDSMEMEPPDGKAKTSKIGKDARLFSHRLGVYCTEDMPIKKTVTFTSFRVQTQNATKHSTKTHTLTCRTTIVKTQYPLGLDTTVTTTVRPIETVFVNATRTRIVNETVTLERQIPRNTHYHVCSEPGKNILSWAPDRRMIKEWTHQDHEVNPTEVKVGDYISCCNECMKRPLCQISFFGKPPDATRDVPESCYMYITQNRNQCLDGAQPVYAKYIGDGKQAQLMGFNSWEAPYYTFSNGPCGQLKYGGQLPLVWWR
ncbi:hypothetical protein ACKAV7_010994 [Fusarium commune]